MTMKKITGAIIVLFVVSFTTNTVNATEECFENVSRSIFKFNMAFDDIILEPIAKGYNKLPSPIKKGTSNFTSNIATLLSIPNSVLQGNFSELGNSTASVLINSTFGVLGFFNPAATGQEVKLRLDKERIDYWLSVGAQTSERVAKLLKQD